MGDKMKCPKCGYEVASGVNMCPNCHTFLNPNQPNVVSSPPGVPLNQTAALNSTPVNPNLNLNNGVQVNPNINNVVSSNPNTNIPASQVSNNIPNVNAPLNQEEKVEQLEVLPEYRAETVANPALESNSLNSENAVTNPEVPLKTAKDKSKIYYLILVCAIVIFLILMGFILIKNFKPAKKVTVPPTTKTTGEPVSQVLSKNKGVYSNLASPVNVGEITYGGLKDTDGVITDADVEIIRALEETEINALTSLYNQNLNPGFKWAGVEYKVTLNDFAYLGNKAIDPSMKVYLFDTYYKNNFFLVEDNYYTIEPLYQKSILPIRNGESANISVVYQVPIDQTYYVCFGENFSSLGCFNNY